MFCAVRALASLLANRQLLADKACMTGREPSLAARENTRRGMAMSKDHWSGPMDTVVTKTDTVKLDQNNV